MAASKVPSSTTKINGPMASQYDGLPKPTLSKSPVSKKKPPMRKFTKGGRK